MIHNINKRKDKNHMIISTGTEQTFDKFSIHSWQKTPIKVAIEGAYLNIIKALYDKPIANITLNGEKLKASR